MRNFSRDIRLLTSPLRVLPEFSIVGEAKCGTTSLYRYLLQHPDVLGADRKEPKNFIDYPNSTLYCRSHFPSRAAKTSRQILNGRRTVVGEATAEYFSHPEVAARMKNLVPNIRIIVLFRNPVERALSDYQMLHKTGRVNRGFDSIVDQSIEWLEDLLLSDLVDAALVNEHFYLRIVARGVYINNLKRWRESFPKDNILLLKSEDLFMHTGRVMREVFEFIGVPEREVEDMSVKRSGRYTNDTDTVVMRRLARFYEPHNRQLYDYVGRDYGWESELRHGMENGI